MTESNKITGAEIVIKALIDQGVDTVFGYPGGRFYRFMMNYLSRKKSNTFLLGMSRQLPMLLKAMQDQQVKSV